MRRSWALAVLASLSLASGATLHLAPGPARPLAPTAVSGFNLGNWMPVVEFRDQLMAARPSLLRFPGGNVGDESDLTEASFVPLRTNWGLLARPPLIVQTHVFKFRPDSKNTPEDAAQAARDAQAAGLPVAYWEIGNEPDLYSRQRGDPSWTPEKYCDTFRAQRAAILAVDPQARFAGPATSQPGAFVEAFIKLCGDAVDLLTWHEYPDDGTATDEAALASVARVSDDLKRYQDLLRSPAGNPLGHTRTVQTGVTEYSLSWRTDKARHLSDQVAALWAAEATLRLAEGGAWASAYFALQATGNHGLLDEVGVPRPSYYAFQALAGHGGQALPVAVDDPALWVHAARAGDRLSLIVINTSTAEAPLRLDLPGWQAGDAQSFTAQVVEDEAPMLRLNPADLRLPGRSLTRIDFGQGR